jgi:hypothetical protein
LDVKACEVVVEVVEVKREVAELAAVVEVEVVVETAE